jgi:hypothetical protein
MKLLDNPFERPTGGREPFLRGVHLVASKCSTPPIERLDAPLRRAMR